jgi:hypothetical protein
MPPASRLLALIVGGTVVLGASGVSAQTLKSEPGPGTLPCGETVLVDDGTCGKGKIKQVTGGCNMSGGVTFAGAPSRKRACIRR